MTAKELVEILAVVITVLGSVLVGAITYYRSKRLLVYETFLNKKTKAYEDFLTTVDFRLSNIEEIYQFKKSARVICLYCSEENLPMLDEFINFVFDYYTEQYNMNQGQENRFEEMTPKFKQNRMEVIRLLREEMASYKSRG